VPPVNLSSIFKAGPAHPTLFKVVLEKCRLLETRGIAPVPQIARDLPSTTVCILPVTIISLPQLQEKNVSATYPHHGGACLGEFRTHVLQRVF
jgi:hypothetical protein